MMMPKGRRLKFCGKPNWTLRFSREAAGNTWLREDLILRASFRPTCTRSAEACGLRRTLVVEGEVSPHSAWDSLLDWRLELRYTSKVARAPRRETVPRTRASS